MVQVPADTNGITSEPRKGLELGQHEITELLQRTGLAHLAVSFQARPVSCLQEFHERLTTMQASQPSPALKVRADACL